MGVTGICFIRSLPSWILPKVSHQQTSSNMSDGCSRLAGALRLPKSISYLPIAMASIPPQRPISSAQSMDDKNLDGEMTFQEAFVCTDGMKLMCVDRPIIVHKPIGCVVVGDLPATDEIVDSIKKRLQFLEVLID